VVAHIARWFLTRQLYSPCAAFSTPGAYRFRTKRLLAIGVDVEAEHHAQVKLIDVRPCQTAETYCGSGGRWFESTQLYHRHSDFPRIISPMQQRLALTAPAQEIAGLAMAFDLGDVPANSFPAPDLAGVLGRHAAAHIVTAVPLEPTARIIGVNPSLSAPDRQWLTGIDLEKVQRAVASRF